MIESTATLRYYLLEKYKPLLDKDSLTVEDMKKLIDIDSGHMALPEFQRGYVWNRDQVRGLFDSL